MNFNSITSKISLIFFFSLCILIALFVFYIDYEKKQRYSSVISYHQNISKYLKEQRMPRYEVVKYLKTQSFIKSLSPRMVLKDSKLVYSQRGFETLLYKDEIYLHIITPQFRILFKDLRVYSFTNYSYFIFFVFFTLLLLTYIWLIKSLKPLKDLKENISSFSKGNLNISCKSSKKDEIADVSNEFDNAVRKIELLLSSRQLFLRTIMHELKTPIAKGRIVSELIDDEKQKNRLITVFERLDFMINDFAKIEQIVSNNYDLLKQSFTLKEILDDSLNILMLDSKSDNLEINIDLSYKLKADLSLMSMVFKNLIDNALRYSSNKALVINQKGNCIEFISKGEKLNKPIEEYFKPFHNETKSKNHGMGLGLYIVKSILDIHNMSFDYKYVQNNNVFIISL